jgi:hypothetical protein
VGGESLECAPPLVARWDQRTAVVRGSMYADDVAGVAADHGAEESYDTSGHGGKNAHHQEAEEGKEEGPKDDFDS